MLENHVLTYEFIHLNTNYSCINFVLASLQVYSKIT